MRVHTVFQTISGQPCIFSLYTKFIPRNFVIFKINFFLQIGIFSEKKIFQCKQLLRNFVEKGRYQVNLAFSVMNEIHPRNFVIFQNCNFSANLDFFQRKNLLMQQTKLYEISWKKDCVRSTMHIEDNLLNSKKKIFDRNSFWL